MPVSLVLVGLLVGKNRQEIQLLSTPYRLALQHKAQHICMRSCGVCLAKMSRISRRASKLYLTFFCLFYGGHILPRGELWPLCSMFEEWLDRDALKLKVQSGKSGEDSSRMKQHVILRGIFLQDSATGSHSGEGNHQLLSAQ